MQPRDPHGMSASDTPLPSTSTDLILSPRVCEVCEGLDEDTSATRGDFDIFDTTCVRTQPAAFALSPDQEHARQIILTAIEAGRREMVLTGPAGSGKTTLLRALIVDIHATRRRVILAAPTGKAASRLSEVTGRTATTIHKALYQKVREDEDGKAHFSAPRAVGAADTVIIADEASMLGEVVYKDLVAHLPHGAVLLCVGDREQLMPVNDTWGANFANPTATLTEVHRQALESPILALATHVRGGLPWRKYDPCGKAGYKRVRNPAFETVIDWMLERRRACDDAVLLTYTNATRQILNAAMREALGRQHMIEVGDRLVCTKNNQDVNLMNGEVFEVCSVEYTDDRMARVTTHAGQRVLVAPWLLKEQQGGTFVDFKQLQVRLGKNSDASLMLLRAEYGEALTVHRSQGSQWQKVGIVHDFGYMQRSKPDEYRRLMYTAITRAAEHLVIFDRE